MSVTLSDRDTAGAAYATALATWKTAYIDLAAKERILENSSLPPFGAKFNDLPGRIDLLTLQHPQYALPDYVRLEDAIQARMAVLRAS
ncbi:MAG TPA: hypothetical protein VH206_14320 [Xanthobacteraceae bacterium]|jgi:hypothetical protein|nr:hypothetical protein [Xanthobacteraceae bacterium]